MKNCRGKIKIPDANPPIKSGDFKVDKKFFLCFNIFAFTKGPVAELVYARHLKCRGFDYAGSTPAWPTTIKMPPSYTRARTGKGAVCV